MTAPEDWYSARIRLVCLIEGEGAARFQDSVVLLRASSFQAALTRAVDVGRSHEEEYTNADGQRVVWRLKEIISLDVVKTDLDGAEVYSEPVELAPAEQDPFDTVYTPEGSQPTQTI
ncbi:MAG: DUF4288 domain-containing protein [Actinomycetota bacterium]|nr:DUF4288 domain-containing protein [Actinomycetota bacterium]